MSVIEKPMESKLKLVVNVTKEGKTTTSTRSYGKVKPDAENSGVYAVGAALAGLQVNPINRITCVKEVELSESV